MILGVTLSRVMISFEHQFIFYELQKTASSSVCASLLGHMDINKEKSLAPPLLQPIIDRHQEVYDNHLRRERKVPLWRDGHWAPSTYRQKFKAYNIEDDFIKVGAIRNSWDRLLSAYLHNTRDITYKSPYEKRLNKKLSHFESFEDFCLSLESSTEPDYTRGHFGYQLNWYRGAIGSTIFIHFDKLISDFTSIMKSYFGLDATLDFHINKSPNRDADYRKHYTPRTKAIVGRHYQRDIEAFGFEF